MSQTIFLPRPEDAFIALARNIGEWTAPYLDPIEHYLRSQLPLPSFAKEWLADHTSVHATKLPLMNPFHVLVIVLAYFAMILLGKAMMAPVKAFQLKSVMIFHNLGLLTLSAYMCGSILLEAWKKNYSLVGNPVDETSEGWPMARLIWLFYVSKTIEFVDTLIMVLKKNDRQISFLHVYHHFSIFVIWWIVTRWAPTGEAYFSAALNSFIHVVMYGYYLCMGIGIRSAAFVKRYITSMQMTQFCCMMGQAMYNIYHGYFDNARQMDTEGREPYPLELSTLLLVYMWTMLGLFANFFIQDGKRANAARKMGANGINKPKRNQVKTE